MQFNLSNLSNIYNQAIENGHPTIAFRLVNGQGIFTFMMFFSDDDESKDALFIFLGRTQVLLRLKMYGNHKKGVFDIYTNKNDDQKILDEINIGGGNINYDQERLFQNLNENIPQILPLRNSIAEIRRNRHAVLQIPNIVDDNTKIYLIGTMKLSSKRSPQEKTLRKLYLYVDAGPAVIEKFLLNLRNNNMTLAWSDDHTRERSLNEIM